MPTQLSDAWEVKEWLQNAMQLDLDQHDWMKTLLQEFAALGANRESDIRGIPSWKIHNLKGIVPESYRKKFDVAIQKKNEEYGRAADENAAATEDRSGGSGGSGGGSSGSSGSGGSDGTDGSGGSGGAQTPQREDLKKSPRSERPRRNGNTAAAAEESIGSRRRVSESSRRTSFVPDLVQRKLDDPGLEVSSTAMSIFVFEQIYFVKLTFPIPSFLPSFLPD